MSTTHTARTATSLTLLSAIALLAGCDHAPAPTSRTLVEGSVSSFLKHWNAQDAKALSTLFAEDGVRVVSSNQLPVYGRDAICKQFEDAFADGSPFEGATLSAAVLSTRDLPGDLVIGDGTFEVKGNNGDSLLTGKWGNIFRVHAGQIHLVMESAHADIPLDADRSAYAKAAREPAPKVDNSGAKELLPAFQRSADRYITAVGEMSPKLLAAEFMADGVRVVSSSAAACRGTAEITQAATSEFAKGSPFEKTTLWDMVESVQFPEAKPIDLAIGYATSGYYCG